MIGRSGPQVYFMGGGVSNPFTSGKQARASERGKASFPPIGNPPLSSCSASRETTGKAVGDDPMNGSSRGEKLTHRQG